MLYVLTGAVQMGKTRWLECLVSELESHGVRCFGVISPGIWRTVRTGNDDVDYEKLGIESLFLPGKTRGTFAHRRDLAERKGIIDTRWQSSRAGLIWAIPDDALACVNRHFDNLEAQMGVATGTGPVAATSTEVAGTAATTTKAVGTVSQTGLFIVDELGRLELEEEGGLTSAVRLLERGPTDLYRHALIIARDWLVDKACARFADAWHGARTISPDDGARHQVAAALGITL
jgi:hypothetical protein